MRYLPATFFVFAYIGVASVLRAQTPPIFGGGVGLYDPEVDVLNIGAVLDAQVVVSEDRRYVTINAQPSISSLNSLAQFQVSSTSVGFVGGGNGVGSGTGVAPNPGRSAKPTAKPAGGNAKPVDPPTPPGVLGRRGIFQLATLPSARR